MYRAALSERLGIKISQLNYLYSLIDKNAQVVTDEMNEDGAPDSVPFTEKVIKYAKKLGYDTIWPGLYPVLIKDGLQYHIY